MGEENLETNGPAIFVSNHPNAFLDPLILATADKGQFYYIAGAEWFGKGVRNYIFRHEFHMIPVVRPWLKSGEKVSNDQMFEQCYRALAEGKRIVIYPEGTSVTVPMIRALKTGAVRIKEGADRYLRQTGSPWQEVKIIPVGVNYYNPRTFQSDVILNIGPAIDFDAIQAGDEQERVRLMTEHVRDCMAGLVFHFEEEGIDTISRMVYRIYGSHLRRRLHIRSGDKARKFLLQKQILDGVNYFYHRQPEVIDEFRREADQLMGMLADSRLDLRYLGDYRWPFGLAVRLLAGFPVFLLGWMLNFWPYRITRWIFERFLRQKFATTYEAGRLNPSFLASMVFLLGMILFFVWYGLVSIVVAVATGWYWLVPVVIVVGYLTGVFAAGYARLAFDFFRMVRVVNRRRHQKGMYAEIMARWQQLIDHLDQWREEFDRASVRR